VLIVETGGAISRIIVEIGMTLARKTVKTGKTTATTSVRIDKTSQRMFMMTAVTTMTIVIAEGSA